MNLKEQIINDIKSNAIILYMKGTKNMPVCGFSNQLVQILNNTILTQPNRLPYVRQVYQEYTANLRRRRQLGNRNPNSSLLISNKHKYFQINIHIFYEESLVLI